MIFGLFSGNKKRQAELYSQSMMRESDLMSRRSALEEARYNKMERQSELWTILNLSSELEGEYYNVSQLIAQLVKEIGAIDDYLDDLRIARNICSTKGECTALEEVLKIVDPWAEKIRKGEQDAVPKVLPTSMR